MKTGIGHIAVCQKGCLGIVEDCHDGKLWTGRKIDGTQWQSVAPIFLDYFSEVRVKELFKWLNKK